MEWVGKEGKCETNNEFPLPGRGGKKKEGARGEEKGRGGKGLGPGADLAPRS